MKKGLVTGLLMAGIATGLTGCGERQEKSPEYNFDGRIEKEHVTFEQKRSGGTLCGCGSTLHSYLTTSNLESGVTTSYDAIQGNSVSNWGNFIVQELEITSPDSTNTYRLDDGRDFVLALFGDVQKKFNEHLSNIWTTNYFRAKEDFASAGIGVE